MGSDTCKECLEEPFTQCKDNPCNYRIKTSLLSPHQNYLTHTPCVLTEADILYRYRNPTKNDELLVSACINGNRDQVKRLLCKGANPNAFNKYDSTGITYAIQGGCTHILDMLIEYGRCNLGELRYSCAKQRNFLHFAIDLQKPKMVKHLLHLGFDPNSDVGSLKTILTTNNEIFELMMSHGTDMEKMVKNGETLANRMIKVVNKRCKFDNEVFISIFKILLKYVNLEQCENQEYSITGMSLLHHAANRNNVVFLEYLLKLGIDPNSCISRKNKTPLHLAARNDNEVLKTLLKYGSKVEVIDRQGDTPLHIATNQRRHENVRDLLLFGARFDVVNFKGKTAVHSALDKDDDKSIEWMLLFGADFYEIENLANMQTCPKVQEMLAKYMIKKRIIQMDQDLDVFVDSKLIKFKNKCKKEIEQIRSLKILDDKVNCIDLLYASKRKLVKIASNESANEMMGIINSYFWEFPNYRNLFWKIINIAVLYQPVYDRAVEALNNLVNFQLPILAIEIIMIYLNIDDMKNLIKTSQQLDHT